MLEAHFEVMPKVLQVFLRKSSIFSARFSPHNSFKTVDANKFR